MMGRIPISSESPVKVPNNLPLFQTPGEKNSADDALDFLERFEIVCIANEVPMGKWVKMLPLCLQPVERTWFLMFVMNHTKSSQKECSWDEIREGFLEHFEHPNEAMYLMEKLRSLKMKDSARAYSDEFLRIMLHLQLDIADDTAVFLFKAGLKPWLLDQVTATEANQLLTQRMSGERAQKINVEMLAEIAQHIEANQHIHRLANNGDRQNPYSERGFGGHWYWFQGRKEI